ncbi:MAG: NYN domain-containing protein [Microthrixaceae bacterium]
MSELANNNAAGGAGASGRTLALCDIENLLVCRPADAFEPDYVHAVSHFAAAAGLERTDHVVVGIGPRPNGVFGARDAWPSAVIRVRPGADGADRALTDELWDLEAVQRSHTKVVIGSGDHHFVPAVSTLNELGIHTTVVSWPDRLSRELRAAAREIRLLSDQPSCSGVGSRLIAA